jgi:hypothetical protein
MVSLEHNGWDHGLKVTDDGTGLAGHGGGVLLRKLADQCGTAALEAALARAGTFPQLSRGMVVVSMAVAIALKWRAPLRGQVEDIVLEGRALQEFYQMVPIVLLFPLARDGYRLMIRPALSGGACRAARTVRLRGRR